MLKQLVVKFNGCCVSTITILMIIKSEYLDIYEGVYAEIVQIDLMKTLT